MDGHALQRGELTQAIRLYNDIRKPKLTKRIRSLSTFLLFEHEGIVKYYT